MPEASEYKSFDRVADIYEATRHIPADRLAQVVKGAAAAAGLHRGARVLDAGVGTGRFARHLAAAGLEVVGVDVAERMMAQAHAADARLMLLRADLRRLPLRSAAVDAVLFVHVLHLVADWHRVLAEARRVLSPGGSLLIGSEGGRRLRCHQVYHEVAHERGLVRPNLGAESFHAILKHLAGLGADLAEVAQSRAEWPVTVRVGDMLALMRRNVYSHLWHIPSGEFASLADEAERRLLGEFGSPDATETSQATFALWRATW